MRRRSFVALPLLSLLAFFVAVWMVPLPERLNYPGSTVVFFRDGAPAHVFLSPDDKWRVPITLEEVDPFYLTALIRLEDQRFYYHPGVDPLAIARAAYSNIQQARIASGASTITMQLVRILEPRPRTLRSKVIEALRAMQLEVRMSKKEILEAYLRFLPFGKNLEGIEAAALSYFSHRSSSLSAAEVAVMLAVPQSPTRRHPAAKNRETLRRARNRIVKELLDEGVLRRAVIGKNQSIATIQQEVASSPLPAELKSFPRLIPHAATWLRDKYPNNARIYTTLDAGIQGQAEEAVLKARAEAEQRNVKNATVVVIDHRVMEVRALVGNFDFWDEQNGGQLPGFDVRRSVGSTLKPFLYALAIDRGLVLPDFLVPDIPVRYGDYQPVNFKHEFTGLVRLEEALSRSLNVPFAGLLREVGIEEFLGVLRLAGIRSLRSDPGYYGLAAIAGAIEMTPLELAGLYTILASAGEYRHVELLRHDDIKAVNGRPQHDARSIFSPGATWLTVKALSLRDRPDFPARRQIARLQSNVHWKTGTSFGHRDAWAVGSDSSYTVAAWLGNFDNQSSHALVGADIAGPVLFDILEGLSEPSVHQGPILPPSDLKRLEVCAFSGYLPTPACEHRKVILARNSNIPIKTCSFHVRMDIDTTTGLALTPSCRSTHEYRSGTFTVLPSDIARWMRDKNSAVRLPPARSPDCISGSSHANLSVSSPLEGRVVMLIPGVGADRQEVPFEANTNQPDRRLSWFVDGRFVGNARADERLWWTPIPGIHDVVVVDEAGFSARRTVDVRQGG